MQFRTLNEQYASDLPSRPLGKTGHRAKLFSLGGQGSLEEHCEDDSCVEIIRRAYELGVNYYDTSPIYGPEHSSENYYGEALEEVRDTIFLASKSDRRDRDGALEDIEGSLRRLKTDYLDLWQIHHIDEMDEVNEITGPGGALEAFIEMKEQGVVRNIGITGHQDPELLWEMMNRHRFDTVLCPINPADKHMDKSFIEIVLPEAKSQNMGIIGMKVYAQGYVFHEDGITTKWEPINYALSQEISTIIVGCRDIAQLEENIALAKSFKQLSLAEMEEIEKKTKKYVGAAQFFRAEFGGYDSKEKLGEPLIS